MRDAKKHIKEIQQKYISSPELTLDSLTGAIDRLQKAFPRRGHFVMEFIQNADDAESRSLKIMVGQKEIKILNNGLPFSKGDVESICRVGRSSKTAQDYIGYLGVGFKSAFLITECPQIYSGDYSFKFDKYYWSDSKHTPWQVMPIWVDSQEFGTILGTKYKTAFILPLSRDIDEDIVEKLKEEVAPEHLSDRILLFLRNLKELEIYNEITKTTRTMVKSDNTSPSKAYEIYTLEEQVNGALTHQDRWAGFRSVCQVPPEVKEDYITKDWEREDVTSREVLVAFKLGDDDRLVEETGTAHIGVFSFLPLKEIPSGLKFLIQADFLTAPGREVIHREALWNEWLAREVLRLLTRDCIKGLLRHDMWRFSASKILYPGDWGHPLFDEQIKIPLREYLNDNPVLIAEDGTRIKANKSVTLGSEVRELLSKKDLRSMYPDKKALHQDCETVIEVEEGPSTLLEFVQGQKAQDLMKEKALSESIRWFRRLYSRLAGYNDAFLRKELNYETIILTSKNAMARPNEVYIRPTKLVVPPEVEGNFKLVHPGLLRRRDVLQFLTKLGIETLSEEHIQGILRTREIPEMGKGWPKLSESAKIEKLKMCKDLWQKQQIDIKDLSFLTLKTKSGKWLPPSDILFSKEYKPDHIIETLVEKDLLDLPLEFLSQDLIGSADNQEVAIWREFFGQLGVEEKLNGQKQHLVQRVGIKTTLLLEKDHKREARELGESEKPGYDVVSKSPSEERHIEVKGSGDINARIPLTKREFETLQKEQDKYFVYVVEAALQNPRLYVIRGSELVKAAFSFITIESKQWKPLKEEEFQPQL